MILEGNWVDLVILVFLMFYAIGGVEKGFFVMAANLISFLGSLVLALKFYSLVASLLTANFYLSSGFANALGFLAIALVSETILGISLFVLYSRVPRLISQSVVSKILGIFPAILDGLIVSAFFLTIIIALPVSGFLKKDIFDSRIGTFLVHQTSGFERTLNDVFGGAINETLTFLTIKPESGERIDLKFRLDNSRSKVDENSENVMLGLVNNERSQRGLKNLRIDPKITQVAREHSRDMFLKGYFAHINPEGKDPFKRMREGGVTFRSAGENLALAPDVRLAHEGLMNSEGHRRNILDPVYSRVGIGVIDGGVYGKMYTQNFAD